VLSLDCMIINHWLSPHWGTLMLNYRTDQTLGTERVCLVHQ
jgi:hypothetical protein